MRAIHLTFIPYLRLLIATAFLIPALAHAYSTGITGQSTAGCTLSGCHGDSPGSYNYTGSVQHNSGG